MGPCLSTQKNRNAAYHSAHSMKCAANNPPKDIEGNLIQLFEKADKSKFRFDEVISEGATRTRSPGRRRRLRADLDGIASSRRTPSTSIVYQTRWRLARDQQKYTPTRKGWQGPAQGSGRRVADVDHVQLRVPQN